MKYCTKCGTQLHDDNCFCTSCGNLAPLPNLQEKKVNNEISNTNSKFTSNLNNRKHTGFKKIFSNNKIVIAITASILSLLIIGIICLKNVPFYKHIFIEKEVTEILRNDLNSSVEIIKLYHNEEKQGCFAEFQTNRYTDKAAIKMDTGERVYGSDYDYWSTKIGIHEYNQKILDSAFYAEWNFAITVFESKGRPANSEWKRIK